MALEIHNFRGEGYACFCPRLGLAPTPHPIVSPSAIKASNPDDADDCWSDEVVAITNNLSATEPVCENSEGLDCESPWRLRTEDSSRGPLLSQRFSPPIPAETGRHYSESLAVDRVVPATAFNLFA